VTTFEIVVAVEVGIIALVQLLGAGGGASAGWKGFR
jgi:hypothetical protein